VIVECTLRVVTDEGTPAIVAEGRRMVVQEVADFEGNLLKAAAALGDLVADAERQVQAQVAAYRRAIPAGLDPRDERR
jgi:hypothetical protein